MKRVNKIYALALICLTICLTSCEKEDIVSNVNSVDPIEVETNPTSEKELAIASEAAPVTFAIDIDVNDAEVLLTPLKNSVVVGQQYLHFDANEQTQMVTATIEDFGPGQSSPLEPNPARILYQGSFFGALAMYLSVLSNGFSGCAGDVSMDPIVQSGGGAWTVSDGC